MLNLAVSHGHATGTPGLRPRQFVAMRRRRALLPSPRRQD